MGRFALLPFCLFALACAPEDGTMPDDGIEPDVEAPVDDAPVDDTDPNDTGDEPPADPLNLSFESPAVGDGNTAPPAAWSTDEVGDARAFVFGDAEGAVDGAQYLAIDIDGRGRSWVTSPELATLVEGQQAVVSFSLRSDCPTAILTLFAGDEADGMAMLPMPSTWTTLSFMLVPDADQAGQPFSLEIVNEASSPCSLEIDRVRVQ
ncbi:MAG: hypothetical protein EP330_00595 [Deltaproteobacteria bacterium]|nr:MAG: hypothetical protein EP330_00595 [Deltaproteobacteria bacterium]